MFRRTFEGAVYQPEPLAGWPTASHWYLGPLIGGCFGFLAAMLIALFF